MSKHLLLVWFCCLLVLAGSVAVAAQPAGQDDFHRGISLYEQGQLTEAKVAFQAALQVTPEDPVVLTWCGTIALQLD